MKYDEIQEDYTELISHRSCMELSSTIDGDYFLEDTGLYIRSLRGFPGPYSSFVKSTLDCEGIIRALAGSKDRSAYFKTVISLRYMDRIIQFGGILNGTISDHEAGIGGFGFDSIFVPEGGVQRTLAELDMTEKNRISHRGRAISALITFLKGDSIS